MRQQSQMANFSLRMIVSTAAFGSALFLGCGGSAVPEGGDVPSDGLGDGGSRDGGLSDATTDATVGPCRSNGGACAGNGECCSALCDRVLGQCVPAAGNCSQVGVACTASSGCCSGRCVGGACTGGACVADGTVCTDAASCCSGRCDGPVGGTKSCTPQSGTCKSTGNPCALPTECCSRLCTGGTCAAGSSFCVQTGDACSNDTECCGGLCASAPGALLGSCVVAIAPGGTGCTVAGQACDGATDGGSRTCGGSCCSRACAPYGRTGVSVCQPPSGCRPTGELCRVGADCCGSAGQPGGNGSVTCSKANPTDTYGRCDNGQACRAAGAVCKLPTSSCNAENNCCAGNVNQNPLACQQDILGIPRCTIAAQACADGGSLQGQPCASSADCCGLACVPTGRDAGAAFVCGGACVQTGDSCTTTADCCAGGECLLPAGSSRGICGSRTPPRPTVDAGLVDGGRPTVDAGLVEAGDGGPSPALDGGLVGIPCAEVGQLCGGLTTCCDPGMRCLNGRCDYPIF